MKNIDIHTEFQEILTASDKDIDSLKVITHTHDNYVEMISCWKASWWERFMILITGKVYIHTLGTTTPPLKCSADYRYIDAIVAYRKALIEMLTTKQKNN